MARSDRLQVTVSPAMSFALESLARRSGLTVSTQAMVLLRQALDRTIQTAEVQEALRRHRLFADDRQREADQALEHVVEGSHAIERSKAEWEDADSGTEEAVEGAREAAGTPTA